MTQTFADHKAVQDAAKQVLAELRQVIEPSSTEESIANFSAQRLSEIGFPNTWYYSCPALVLAGDRSCLSISGRDYTPSKEPIGRDNLVTVDLSPCANQLWGDCARSFAIEGGSITNRPSQPEVRRGIDMVVSLHAAMLEFVTPEIKFSELHEFAHDLIATSGYVNLDFRGNLGHSIGKRLENRIYIDASENSKLESVSLFTFEPHICEADGMRGFKHENIYYFDDNGVLVEL